MKEVDFTNSKPGKKGNGSGISFMRFESGKTYKIRPFGSAVEFYKIFVGRGKPSIIVDPDDKDAASQLLSEHSGTEMRASYRNAMFVLDREDDNKIKVLEGGSQIFDAFGAWSSNSGVKPGSGQAGEWAIAVTGEGVGGSNPRKYVPVYLGPVLFTEDEKSQITQLKSDGKLKLANFLKETPLNQVVEAAFGGTRVSNEPAPVAAASGGGGGDDEMIW